MLTVQYLSHHHRALCVAVGMLDYEEVLLRMPCTLAFVTTVTDVLRAETKDEGDRDYRRSIINQSLAKGNPKMHSSATTRHVVYNNGHQGAPLLYL